MNNFWGGLDKNVLESGSGDGHTTLCINQKKKNHLIVLVKTVNFVTCELYVNKKKQNKNKNRKSCVREVLEIWKDSWKGRLKSSFLLGA